MEASAADHALCNVSIFNVEIIEEDKGMASHVTITEPWREGSPAPYQQKHEQSRPSTEMPMTPSSLPYT